VILKFEKERVRKLGGHIICGHCDTHHHVGDL
jgi:hypothetical protein